MPGREEGRGDTHHCHPSPATYRSAPMADLPPVKPGFVRIGVRLRPGNQTTPGQLAAACGVDLDHVGPIVVQDHEAYVEVGHDHARAARFGLDRVGPTRVLQFNWQWMKLAIGRNHGLTIGQLRKLLLTADANPLGRLHVNNTHSLIGLQDFKVPTVIAKLATTRINGFAVRPEALPLGSGPGSPAFVPKH